MLRAASFISAEYVYVRSKYLSKNFATHVGGFFFSKTTSTEYMLANIALATKSASELEIKFGRAEMRFCPVLN